MSEIKHKTKTTFVKNYLTEKQATDMYNRLVKLPWKEGIRSKNGFTRLAYSVDETFEDEEVFSIIDNAMELYPSLTGEVAGIYINYYKDGEMYTPNHKHDNTIQLIISLGATRTLKVGNTNYTMGNGDLAFFGSSIHGVPKEPHVKAGRISIAVFIRKI